MTRFPYTFWLQPAYSRPQASPYSPRFAADNMQTAEELRTSKLVGSKVYNSANENIGSIEDIILKPDGSMDEVVLSVGGFLGMGDKYVAVPFSDLKITRDGSSQKIVTNGTKEIAEGSACISILQVLNADQATVEQAQSAALKSKREQDAKHALTDHEVKRVATLAKTARVWEKHDWRLLLARRRKRPLPAKSPRRNNPASKSKCTPKTQLNLETRKLGGFLQSGNQPVLFTAKGFNSPPPPEP